MHPHFIDEAYKMYSKALYVYAYSLCKNVATAEDLVSDAFYKALLSYDRQEESFQYWLYRVVKNQYLDEKKRNHIWTRKAVQFKQQIEQQNMQTMDHPNGQMILDQLIEEEQSKHLLEIILNLEPDVYKEVILLYYYNQLSVKEIAGLLEKTENDVKVILYRARKKLGKVIGGKQDEF